MIRCYCQVCGKYIGEFYPSQVRKTCSDECRRELLKQTLKGENNPNFRHGKYIENRCKSCGKLIDPRATYCHKCRPDRGHQQSKETRKKIGEKSKAKWTEDYKRKHYYSKYAGKKRIINGYVYIKDYSHPNRNSHNLVPEHVLVMTQHLGRPLENGEVIHHIDGDKTNNDISNLYLCKDKSEHRKIHASFDELLKPLLDLGIVYFDRSEGRYKLGGGDC